MNLNDEAEVEEQSKPEFMSTLIVLFFSTYRFFSSARF